MKRNEFFTKVSVGGVEEHDFLWNPLSTFEMNYRPSYYRVNGSDWMRPWMISYKAYGVTDFWWVIMFVNGIDNPFTDLTEGLVLAIPNRLDIFAFAKKYRVI